MIEFNSPFIKKIKKNNEVENSIVVIRPECLKGKYIDTKYQLYKIVFYDQLKGLLIGESIYDGVQIKMSEGMIIGIAKKEIVKKIINDTRR